MTVLILSGLFNDQRPTRSAPGYFSRCPAVAFRTCRSEPCWWAYDGVNRRPEDTMIDRLHHSASYTAR